MATLYHIIDHDRPMYPAGHLFRAVEGDREGSGVTGEDAVADLTRRLAKDGLPAPVFDGRNAEADCIASWMN